LVGDKKMRRSAQSIANEFAEAIALVSCVLIALRVDSAGDFARKGRRAETEGQPDYAEPVDDWIEHVLRER
jgi:hypothetical protein